MEMACRLRHGAGNPFFFFFLICFSWATWFWSFKPAIFLNCSAQFHSKKLWSFFHFTHIFALWWFYCDRLFKHMFFFFPQSIPETWSMKPTTDFFSSFFFKSIAVKTENNFSHWVSEVFGSWLKWGGRILHWSLFRDNWLDTLDSALCLCWKREYSSSYRKVQTGPLTLLSSFSKWATICAEWDKDGLMDLIISFQLIAASDHVCSLSQSKCSYWVSEVPRSPLSAEVKFWTQTSL